MVLELIIAATVLVSLISLVGILLFSFEKKSIDQILFFLVSFSAGTLLGAAMFDLIPEALAGAEAKIALEMVFAGLMVAFAAEKLIHWHHHHAGTEKEHTRPLGTLAMAGDSIHNFFDGVAIAAAFMVSPPLGITTTIAIALHEIPQEIGDFGLLLYSGFSKRKAILFNLLSAFFAIAGGAIFYFFSSVVSHIESYALAFAAGNMIYIAAVDLLPEIHKEKKWKNSAVQLVLILLGSALIWAIARYLE